MFGNPYYGEEHKPEINPEENKKMTANDNLRLLHRYLKLFGGLKVNNERNNQIKC